MKDKAKKSDDSLAKAELAVAIAVTAMVVVFHYHTWRSAEAMWRDEAGSINMASAPSLAEVCRNLQYDSFPIVTPLVLRGAMAAGITSDNGLRALGAAVGLGTLALLWVAARQFGCRVPLLSLLLFGASALSVRYVDSLRPYGIGIVLMLATLILVHRATFRTSLWSVAAAGIAAILSMQTLYQNAFPIAAFAVAGMAVAAVERRWRDTLLLAAIPVAAAISVLPYLPAVRANSANWGLLVARSDIDLATILRSLTEALAFSGRYMPIVWVVLVAAAFVVAGIGFSGSGKGDNRSARSQTIFFTVVLVASTVVFLGFFMIFQHLASPWYFLQLMAVAAICLDVLLRRQTVLRWGAVTLAVVAMVATLAPSWRACGVPHTNIDRIAAKVTESAGKDDLVIVNPWYLAGSFERYYHGQAPCVTLPPMEDHRIHRFDLLKAAMASQEPISPVLQAARRTLDGGHTIWVVGMDPEVTNGMLEKAGGLRPGEWISGSMPLGHVAVTPLPPAPGSGYGWSMEEYGLNWEMQLFACLGARPTTASMLMPATDQPPLYETCHLVEVQPPK